ncbi:protein Shroom2 isoform X2 [Chiloscyllium punctatum]|uniref:protein Shroom2 isoform X2 n=1 Tax=Chiloscyllium punctatum TaxID=137246 RepID=UPI003B63B909
MAGGGVRTKGAAAASAAPEEQAMGEQQRRAAEGSRCVEVALSGGAPWGFTLRGGREHKEPLLITKIEEGSKAAAVGKLQVGDEMVGINDVILTGYRQEAICLVKGSHRTLKLVVRSSSSNDLSDKWDETTLQRVSDQFSSLGSMDSLDQHHAIYQGSNLSPTHSSNSMDHISGHSKRDSAYSSFSTSSSTPDYTLSSSKSDTSSSTENVLNRGTPWEAPRPSNGNGRPGPSAAERSSLEDRPVIPGPEDTARPDEHLGSRPQAPGRTSFGPVWHVPERRGQGETRAPRRISPPPLPPVRSDSYAATKVHEKAQAGGPPDGNGTSRQQASAKPQLRGDWALEGTEHEGRRAKLASPLYWAEAAPPAPWDDNKQPSASKLSLSSTDIRYSQPTLSSSHQRQHSDESNFHHSDSTRMALWGNGLYHGPQQTAPESAPHSDWSQTRPTKAAVPAPTSSWQPDLAGAHPALARPECCDSQKGAAYSFSPDHSSSDAGPWPAGYQVLSLDGHVPCRPEAGASRLPYGPPGHLETGRSQPPSGRCWPQADGTAVCPDRTPLLHSLAQESRRLPPEASAYPQVKQQQRRSDRFATALRNEIQTKRAQLQKSKSAAALAPVSPEIVGKAGDTVAEWLPDAPPSPDVTSCASYKDDLKEAQARVLRATSFQRRDLGPVAAPRQSLSPAAKEEGPSPPSALHPRVPVPLTRLGGRKRLTPEQKLRSYSEPEKINEVGTPDEAGISHPPPPPGTEPHSSFADRRHFFEAGGRPLPLPAQGLRPGGTEAQLRLHGKGSGSKAEDRPLEAVVRDQARVRASSLGGGCESGRRAPDPGGSWPLRYMAPQTSGLPEQPNPAGYPRHLDPSGHKAGPQRLGTFAEYQATWREQRKVPEARGSGRFHSADDILEQSFQEPASPQYVHERSRSSPSTDFYVQDVPAEARRRPEGFQREMEQPAAGAEGGRSSPPARFLEPGSVETASEGLRLPLERGPERGWSERNAPADENQARDWREGPVDAMLSGHPGVDEDQFERRPGSDGPTSQGLSQLWAVAGNLAWSGETQASPTQPLPGVGASEAPTTGTDRPHSSDGGNESWQPMPGRSSRPAQAEAGNVELREDAGKNSAFHPLPTFPPDSARAPSPQFAPQRLTDKPPPTVEGDRPLRIEKVTDYSTTVKKVPIKIVRSESQTEKESRHNLLNRVVEEAGCGGRDQQREAIGSCQHSSPFTTYSRQELDPLRDGTAQSTGAAGTLWENKELSPMPGCGKAKERSAEEIKSEELAREIVHKDRTLADILYPNSKLKTTMDLMEGIFPKDETVLQEAQQRRKLLPSRPYSPKPTEDREGEIMPMGVSLTTSSTYYSTSAPKAELLNKMKDMQQQIEQEEDSEDELNHDLTEKKQELIDSISKKLQVLREARESLQDDIQANNLLGNEVEAIVKQVCKPNEFEKFRMFIGDLDKVVNLLLSLSGRLARVENALNTLDEEASPDERKTLTQKQKLLTRQHEDAKELKENLDRREGVVFDILSSYLTDELLQDYEHFVKMKSALIIEQRELEDKIKLGEEQLKCLLESLPVDGKPK